jgi:mitogen-activated protein kinase kinase kinase 1
VQEASQSVDKAVESEDIAKDSIAPQKPEADAPKSGKGVLKSVAGGITLVGAVFFMVHLRCVIMFALLHYKFAAR